MLSCWLKWEDAFTFWQTKLKETLNSHRSHMELGCLKESPSCQPIIRQGARRRTCTPWKSSKLSSKCSEYNYSHCSSVDEQEKLWANIRHWLNKLCDPSILPNTKEEKWARFGVPRHWDAMIQLSETNESQNSVYGKTTFPHLSF